MTQFRIQNFTVLGLILMLTAGAAFSAGNDGKSFPQSEALCSDAWYQSIEKKVLTGDGQGHGPDLGSDEWKSVVDFKLGIRGQPDVPGRDSQAWCRCYASDGIGISLVGFSGKPTVGVGT